MKHLLRYFLLLISFGGLFSRILPDDLSLKQIQQYVEQRAPNFLHDFEKKNKEERNAILRDLKRDTLFSLVQNECRIKDGKISVNFASKKDTKNNLNQAILNYNLEHDEKPQIKKSWFSKLTSYFSSKASSFKNYSSQWWSRLRNKATDSDIQPQYNNLKLYKQYKNKQSENNDNLVPLETLKQGDAWSCGGHVLFNSVRLNEWVSNAQNNKSDIQQTDDYNLESFAEFYNRKIARKILKNELEIIRDKKTNLLRFNSDNLIINHLDNQQLEILAKELLPQNNFYILSKEETSGLFSSKMHIKLQNEEFIVAAEEQPSFTKEKLEEIKDNYYAAVRSNQVQHPLHFFCLHAGQGMRNHWILVSIYSLDKQNFQMSVMDSLSYDNRDFTNYLSEIFSRNNEDEPDYLPEKDIAQDSIINDQYVAANKSKKIDEEEKESKKLRQLFNTQYNNTSKSIVFTHSQLQKDCNSDQSASKENDSYITFEELSNKISNNQKTCLEKIDRALKRKKENIADLNDEEKRIISLPHSLSDLSISQVRSLRQLNTWECGFYGLYNAQFIEDTIKNAHIKSPRTPQSIDAIFTQINHEEYSYDHFAEFYENNIVKQIYQNHALEIDPCSNLPCPVNGLEPDQRENCLDTQTVQTILSDHYVDSDGKDRFIVLTAPEGIKYFVENAQYTERVLYGREYPMIASKNIITETAFKFRENIAQQKLVEPCHFLCQLDGTISGSGHWILISIVQNPWNRSARPYLIVMDPFNDVIPEKPGNLKYKYIKMLYRLFVDLDAFSKKQSQKNCAIL